MRKTLDVRGRACPIPIVELMRAIKTMADGDEIDVHADDRAFPSDVRAWCSKTGHCLVDLATREEAHVATVRKEAQP
jgi:TusA-related sulfurtransferase